MDSKSTTCYMPKFLLRGQNVHLTSWSRILPEKLICTQLVKTIPALYGTRRFITLHAQIPATCPCPDPDYPVHSLTFQFLTIHLNIILLTRPVSSKLSLIPQVTPPKPCIDLSSPYVLHALPNSILSILLP